MFANIREARRVLPARFWVIWCGQVVTLEPGDVIATGTPAGVGAARGLYLRPGDVVATAIDGLGRLDNPVIDPPGGNP